MRINPSSHSSFVSLAGLTTVLAASAALLLTGCGAGMLAPSTPVTTAIGTITGSVHGGRQPIGNARIFLLAVGTGGYGTASDSLITTGPTDPGGEGNAYDLFTGDHYVLSSADGSFQLAGTYTCNPGQAIYMATVGGDTGGGIDQPAAGLMAALAICPNDGSNSLADVVPAVQINEVSTIAAAYALAGYASNISHIASSGTTQATTGLTNAFNDAALLYNVPTGGNAPTATPNGNGTVPAALINTLADVLSNCVNSVTSTSSQCNTLFSDTTSSSGRMPEDTASAAIAIAQNPGANVGDLFALKSQVVKPFTPVLSTAPNDFTLGIIYTGGLSNPGQLAVDAAGDVFINNVGNGSVVALSPQGVPFSGSPFTGGSGNGRDGLAISPTGNVWVANYSDNTLHEYSATGVPTGGNSGTVGLYSYGSTLVGPGNLSFDSLGNFFVPDSANNNVLEFDGGGNLLKTVTYPTASYIKRPITLSLDNNANFWIGNIGSNYLTRFTASAYTSAFEASASKVSTTAVDAANDIWGTSQNNSAVYEYSATGTNLASNGTFTGYGINTPTGIAIDGSGSAFVSNSGGSTFTQISGGAVVVPYSGFQGYSGSGTYLYSPGGVAVDPSGNVWITNSKNAAGNGGSTVTEFIGMAAPVATPLQPGKLGVRP
jgi:streptogramin lyase